MSKAGSDLFDASTLSFKDLRVQELMRILAALYPKRENALAAIKPLDVQFDVTKGLSPHNMWFEIIQRLTSEGKLRDAVEGAVLQFPGNPRTGFLRELLADTPAAVSAEPPQMSAPFDDTVTEPEALLFFDDLTIPTGKVPGLIATLEKLMAVTPAVCLLKVENQLGEFYGTGFRISKKLVLTNHHVLFPKDKVATRVIADFGFETSAAGVSSDVTSLAADVASIDGEKMDDWAVISVAGMKDDWPVLEVCGLPDPVVGGAAFILQHPGGHQKRLGFVRNTISDVKDGTVRYLTDTQPGSSGSPVFDSAARLIAMHNAGGQPVTIAGKPPVAKNQGIRISRVAERLKSKKII